MEKNNPNTPPAGCGRRGAVSFFVIAVFLVCHALPAFSGNATSCVVEINNNNISAHIVGAPLVEVVGKITEATKTKVTYTALPDVLVTANFKDLPLEEGIGRILEMFNYIFFYQPDPGSGPRLKEIKLLFPKEKASEAEKEKRK